MKYGTPNCPTCGKIAMGECDYTPGCAETWPPEDTLKADATTEFEYAGETDMFWDGQLNVNEVEASFLRPFAQRSPEIAERVDFLDKHIRLQCHAGHEWDSTKEDT